MLRRGEGATEPATREAVRRARGGRVAGWGVGRVSRVPGRTFRPLGLARASSEGCPRRAFKSWHVTRICNPHVPTHAPPRRPPTGEATEISCRSSPIGARLLALAPDDASRNACEARRGASIAPCKQTACFTARALHLHDLRQFFWRHRLTEYLSGTARWLTTN